MWETEHVEHQIKSLKTKHLNTGKGQYSEMSCIHLAIT
jgi:hypothetical protein